MSYSSKGFDLKKINYTTITHEGEIENDKQRILNKFNFFFGNSKGQLTSSVHIENNSNEAQNVSKKNTNPNEKRIENGNLEKFIIQTNSKYNTAQKSTMANSIQHSKKNLLNNESKINNENKTNEKKQLSSKENDILKKNSSKVFDFETLSSKKESKSKINNIRLNQKKTVSLKLEEKENEDINSDSDTKKESKELNFKTKNLLSGDFDVDRESDSILDMDKNNIPEKANESYLNNNKLSQNGEY